MLRVIFFKDSQWKKALAPIDSSLDGKTISAKHLQLEKAFSSISISDKGNSFFERVNLQQEENILEQKLKHFTSYTVLIIDEPEAHLHPQWIVDFARVLVLLNKQLGVKVMITSHNPDMVAAIRAISDKEGILEKTRFYLAEQSPNNSYRYIYKDLEQNIGPIFESFNIALSRIEEYGTGSNN